MPRMGFNKRRMESERAAAAAKEAGARRALGRQVIEDAERLVEVRNARQAARMPALADHRRRYRRALLVPLGALPAWLPASSGGLAARTSALSLGSFLAWPYGLFWHRAYKARA